MYVRFRNPNDRPTDDARWGNQAYLRRGIFGMGRYVDVLVQLKMAFEAPQPEWPTPTFPDDEYETHIGYDENTGQTVGLTPEGRTYVRRVEQVKETHSECGTPGIPTFKFSSNDGWHVTRDECAQAIVAYEIAMKAGVAHPAELDVDTIPFLHAAAYEDGFEVW